MSKLFIPYIMGNKDFISNLKVLSDEGADIVEIGLPFSDPVADGPTIMEAGNKAIEEGMNAHKILQELKAHKEELKDTKYVLMTYYNIILHYGEEKFIQDCEEAGVYGLIIPDLPFELGEQLKARFKDSNVKIISLIAMTASDDRIQKIAQHAEGFIYTVTMNATTGENGQFHPELRNKIEYIQENAEVPVVAGFGIRNPEQVATLSEFTDGIVIGSEIVKRFANDSETSIREYLQSIRRALDETKATANS
ncbi:tryptophan synthase subunit alpha [Staphylococcus piscifermentans]|uniref:Tryptophan synthase alpha chain n=1 Tax=Staphylococcus piscifermentans TaxID=70258 RepID=A0A239U6K0_9STAP|nr:tryptophan synthase subunit alpha [Staphylococcus piscifermentans]RTX86547.1 tryptophan synthase subunit alpha [Staphylococcus piscifermentans]GEP83514.1 tryptophan synthase alpha chain [Staphylococcus piscifermentans]SNV04704.1 tryptophan synthase subunit alpha [Staphylococcus piscifermentans]